LLVVVCVRQECRTSYFAVPKLLILSEIANIFILKISENEKFLLNFADF